LEKPAWARSLIDEDMLDIDVEADVRLAHDRAVSREVNWRKCFVKYSRETLFPKELMRSDAELAREELEPKDWIGKRRC
jgi:hypothetical protein